LSLVSTNIASDTMVKSFDLERMPEYVTPMVMMIHSNRGLTPPSPVSNVVIDKITNHEAREALFGYVSNKFCHGKKAALQMTIRDMTHSVVFQVSERENLGPGSIRFPPTPPRLVFIGKLL